MEGSEALSPRRESRHAYSFCKTILSQNAFYLESLI